MKSLSWKESNVLHRIVAVVLAAATCCTMLGGAPANEAADVLASNYLGNFAGADPNPIPHTVKVNNQEVSSGTVLEVPEGGTDVSVEVNWGQFTVSGDNLQNFAGKSYELNENKMPSVLLPKESKTVDVMAERKVPIVAAAGVPASGAASSTASSASAAADSTVSSTAAKNDTGKVVSAAAADSDTAVKVPASAAADSTAVKNSAESSAVTVPNQVPAVRKSGADTTAANAEKVKVGEVRIGQSDPYGTLAMNTFEDITAKGFDELTLWAKLSWSCHLDGSNEDQQYEKSLTVDGTTFVLHYKKYADKAAKIEKEAASVDQENGTINWKVTVTPPTGKFDTQGYTLRDSFAKQDFVKDSFQMNGAAAAATVNGTVLDYTFDKKLSDYNSGKAFTVTYSTRPQKWEEVKTALLHANGMKERSQTFTNTAVLQQKDGVKVGPASASATFQSPVIISKAASFDAAKRDVIWTVTVNQESRKLQHVRFVDDLGTKLLDLNSKIDVSKGITAAASDNTKVIYTPSQNGGPGALSATWDALDKPVTITFRTHLKDSFLEWSSQKDLRITNQAFLQISVADDSHYATDAVAYATLSHDNGKNDGTSLVGAVLKKAGRFNFATQTIPWTIYANKAKLPLTGVTVTDVPAAGQAFVTDDNGKLKYKVTDENNQDITANVASALKDGKATFAFGDSLKNQTATITLYTKVTDANLFAVNQKGNSVTNQADLRFQSGDETKTCSSKATQTWNSAILEKAYTDSKNPTADKDGKVTLPFTVTVNHDKLPMTGGATVTDTLPKGCIVDTASVMVGGKAAGITTKVRDNVAVFTLSSSLVDKKAAVISYNVIADINVCAVKDGVPQQNFTVANHAELTNDGYQTSTAPSAEADATVKTAILNKSVDSKDAPDVLHYAVEVNKANFDMSKFTVGTDADGKGVTAQKCYAEDTLSAGLSLKQSTVQLTNKDTGAVVKADVAYTPAAVSADTQLGGGVLRVSIPAEKGHFVLTYDADIVADKDGTVLSNSVTLNGQASTKASAQNYKFTLDESAGAWGSSHAVYKFTKTDFRGTPLSGATFGLYSDGQLIAEKTSGADGVVSFALKNCSQQQYVLKETAAPDGFTVSEKQIAFTAEMGFHYLSGNQFVKADSYAAEQNVLKTAAFVDESIGQKLTFKKADANTTTVSTTYSGSHIVYKYLSGAQFTFYSDKECRQQVAQATSDKDGVVTVWLAGGEGRSYYFKETAAPSGYKVSTDIYTVTLASADSYETWMDGSKGLDRDYDDGCPVVTDTVDSHHDNPPAPVPTPDSSTPDSHGNGSSSSKLPKPSQASSTPPVHYDGTSSTVSGTADAASSKTNSTAASQSSDGAATSVSAAAGSSTSSGLPKTGVAQTAPFWALGFGSAALFIVFLLRSKRRGDTK